MSRPILILIASLLLSACGAGVEKAKQTLTDSLPIPKDVQFQHMKAYPGGVVCGEYSAYESHVTPLAEFKPFLVIREYLNNPPLALDLAVYCSDDPAQALLQETGIGLFDADNTALAKITADFAALSDALERYYRDNFFYPSLEAGLDALVNPESAPGRPVKKMDEGYLNSLPTDPWGRAYLYYEEQWGRTKGHYLITSLGASGAQGGGGENMDVTSAHLPYLEHIAIILGQR